MLRSVFQGEPIGRCAARILRILVASLAVAAPSSAAGEASAGGLAQLGFEAWTTDQGLAGNWVTDIVETPDGFLWIATSGGLSRFDGGRFRNYTAATESGFPTSQTTALAVGRDGKLWIGFEAGGVRVLEGGRVESDPRLRALSSVAIASLAVDGEGDLWIGTRAGLFHATASGLENVAPGPADQSAEIRRISRAADGGVWVRTRSNGIWQVRGSMATSVEDAPDCVGRDISEPNPGRLITTCAEAIWERSTPSSKWTRVAVGVQSARHLVDREGGLWFTDQTSWKRRFDDRLEAAPREGGLADLRARAIFEDSRREVWVGSFAGGLVRFRRGAASAVGAPEGLPVAGTTAVLAGADGTYWLGGWKDGLFWWDPRKGVLDRWAVTTGWPSGAVWALAADPGRTDRLWVGTAAGLYALEDGRLRPIERPEGRSAQPVRLLVAERDRLWVGDERGGLDELRPDGARRHDRRNGLELDRVRVLRRDGEGFWLAGGDRGVYRLEGDRWHSVDWGLERLHSVRDMTLSSEGVLWVVSDERGLVRVEAGAAVAYGDREGLPFNQIFSVQLDTVGGLWLSGNQGLVRIVVEDFERWARGEIPQIPVLTFSRRDGLREQECNGWGHPASGRLDDGRLVYPTRDGIAFVDPTRLPLGGLVPSRVFIESAWSGPRVLDPRDRVRLGPGERHLGIRFGAIEFERPEAIAFRYRLEGASPDWVLAAGPDVAEFAYLPPGEYRFRLQARLPGEEWVEAERAVAIEVEPRLAEAAWVRFAALAALGAVASLLFFWRMELARRHAVALRGERTLLREVIDTSPNPIFAKRRDLTYALSNRAAAELYGLEPKEVVGRNDAELAPRIAGVERLDALDREVLETAEERVVPEVDLTDAAGRRRWFRVVKRPLRSGTNGVDLIVGTAVEVTEFKLAEEKLRRREGELRASREELRRLASQLLRAQEEERRKLARELHDDLTQRLAGLAMLTGGLARTAARERVPDVDLRLAEIGHDLERLASDAQAMSRDLHPSLLENLGLAEALRAECATFGFRVGLQVVFESRGVSERLPPEVSLGLYRIAQESLRNIAKHARTARARVILEEEPGSVALSISDDGVGFSPTARDRGAGIGLASMAERARLIGAELTVASSPGAGTQIEVRVGLGQAEAPGPSA